MALAVTVTNHGDKACVLAIWVDGVADLTLTRDGKPVASTPVAVDYTDGYDALPASRSRSADPGQSVTLTMATRTVAAVPGGGVVAATRSIWRPAPEHEP